LKGTPIDSVTVLQLLLDGMAAMPGRTGGVELIVDRLGDGTGVNIAMTLTPWKSVDGKSGGAYYWVSELDGGGGEGLPRGHCDDISDFDRWSKLLDQVLRLPRNRSFEAIFWLRHY
jgi:hypothetical protein